MPKPPLPQNLIEMLEKPNPAVMGTVNPQGKPVTVATWYLWDDGRVLLNLDAGRARLAHIRANPNVSLTVLDQEWHSHVSLQGQVTLSDDVGLAGIDRLCRHYAGTDYPDRDRPRVDAWMDVERWHVWGKLRDES